MLIRALLALSICVCCVCVLADDSKSAAEDEKGQKPAELKMLLVPAADGKGFQAVSAETKPQPKNATLIACSSMEFASKGIVFHKATMKHAGHHATASQITLEADRVTLSFSSDVKINLKTKAAKQQFLDAVRR